jgi:predicted dehydrogenase
VVLQLGVHGIDLIRQLFGAIVSVVATTATVQPERNVAGGLVTSTVEDEALATYRFASGALGSHEMSFNEAAGTDRFRLEIYCADATLLLRGTRGPLAIHAPRLTGEPGWFVPALPPAPLGARHHARWLDILRGEIASDPTAEDALEGQRMAEAIYRAAETRHEQRLEPAQGAA